MVGVERFRQVGQRFTDFRMMRFPPDRSREEMVNLPSMVRTDIKQGGVLLPTAALNTARDMVEVGYDDWVANQDTLTQQLSSMVKKGIVGALTPREIDFPADPSYKIFYANRPGITDEALAAAFGGEVGVIGVTTTVLFPQKYTAEAVDVNIVFDTMQHIGIPLAVPNGEVIAGRLSNGEVSTLITAKGEGPEVHIALAQQVFDSSTWQGDYPLRKMHAPETRRKPGTVFNAHGVRLFIMPVRTDYRDMQIPAFGEEKQIILHMAEKIHNAFEASPSGKGKKK